MKNILVFAVISTVLVISCKEKSGSTSADTNTDSTTTVAIAKDSQLILLTKAILTDLKNKDYLSFANYIHPTEGVRFSPYAVEGSAGDLIFTKGKFLSTIESEGDKKITWGEFDGSGEPINFTMSEYINRFVYDVDFLNPEKRSVNSIIFGGNASQSLEEDYPGCDFTESYFSGFEEKYDGMDWRSLRLVFKKADDKYYLVGVIHDEWTI